MSEALGILPSSHRLPHTLLQGMAKVAIEDLSGASTPVTANPYDGLINAVDGDSVRFHRS